MGEGWEDPCAEFRGFFSGFGDNGLTARGEADQCGTLMVGVAEEFDEALLLKAIDQNLNVLTRAESSSSDLGNRLRAETLEKLKSSAACVWERCARIGLQPIGQAIDFNK